MDFRSTINSYYHDNILDLPSSALAPGKAVQIMEQYIPDKRIKLHDITAKTDQDNGITFIGKGGNLPFLGMDITIAFTWTDSQLDFVVTALPGDGWDLSKSFEPLQNGLLQQLLFEAPSYLYLATYDASAQVKEGMTFSGNLKITSGGLQNYSFLANGNGGNVLLEGKIDYEKGAPRTALSTVLSHEINMGFVTIREVDLVLHIESDYNTYSKKVLTNSYVEFKAYFVLTTRNKVHTIPVSATLYDPESNLQFDADLTELVNAAVDELAYLLNDFDPQLLIPTDFHLEDVIRLSHLNFRIDPKGTNKLNAVRLQMDTTRTWDLVKDATGKPIISVGNIQLLLGIYAPFAKENLDLFILGEMGIGPSGIIELSASYPDFTVQGSMKTGTEIRLRDLFTQILGYGSQAVPDLTVFELETTIQPSTGYSLALDVEGNWEIPVGQHTFAVEEVKLAVSYSKEEGTTAYFEGIIGFDNHFIDLKASHPAADEGWIFEGGTAPGQVIAMNNLVADLEYYFDTEFPYFLSNLTLKGLHLTYYTKNSDLAFTCETIFPLENVDAAKWPDLTLGVKLNHVDGKYIKHLKGKLTLMGLRFDAVIDTGGTADMFWGDYQNPGGLTFSIGDIMQLLTTDTSLHDATKDLTINIKDAFVGYYKATDGGATAKWLLGLDMEFGADLSSLPLVGKFIPKDQALRLVFQPRIATQDFSTAEVSALKALMPLPNGTLPESLSKGLLLNIEFHLGSTTIPMALPVGLQNGQLTDKGNTTPPVGPVSAPAEKATWFNLQKSFGPLQLQRVGVQYENSRLSFLLDGGFSIGGLTLSLTGLTASTKLHPIDLSFDLQGLGIEFKKDPIEIGGAFLKEELTDEKGKKYTAYDGMAIIKAKQLNLSAIGSYAEYEGHPSLFLYAVLDMPLGGPAFFFVTGLAAGFGYNRTIKAPALDQVQQFPLVAQAIAGVPGKTDIGTQLRSMHTYIPPAVGEYFLAAGIRFTSFELIDSFALLIVSLGKTVEIDLLGLSTLVLPSAKGQSSALTPLVEVQMALKASFLPEVGFLSVEAKLTNASYLFSKDCHLTGGFAFYSWFSGDHKDDFVLTLGGYHPTYQRPAHFPAVDKLGFNWVINSNLSIKGDAYFALVPSAVMAGAHLSAVWQSGNLKAWFNAGADFIIAWKPYHYDASLYVDIGVSYTYHFFGTHQITAECGADLHIWGPEFAGTAHVHLWIVTFDISFGSTNTNRPVPLLWSEFTRSFLPQPETVCSLSVSAGLEKKTGTGAAAQLVINPKDPVLLFNTLIPVKAIKSQASDNPNDTINLELGTGNINWGIGSMGLAAHEVDSRLVIKVKRGNTYTPHDFAFTPVLRGVPTALWGQSITPSLNGSRLIDQAVCGFEIRATPPKTPAETSFIDRKNFQFALDELSGWTWSETQPFNDTLEKQALNSPQQETTRRNYIRDHLETVQDQRTALLHQLGFTTPVFPDKNIADAFVVAPQFI